MLTLNCPEFLRLLRAAMRALISPGSDFTGTISIRVHVHNGSAVSASLGYEERAVRFDKEVVTARFSK